jgi:hypothetical protein
MTTFRVGQRVKAKLRRGEVVRQGEDIVVDRYRYTVTVATRTRVGLDDGNPETRWPVTLFVKDEDDS